MSLLQYEVLSVIANISEVSKVNIRYMQYTRQIWKAFSGKLYVCLLVESGVNKTVAQYIQPLQVPKCSKCTGVPMLFSDWLFCSACRVNTVRVTAADFSGAFNPTHEYISFCFMIPKFLVSLDMNEIIIEKELEQYMERLLYL